MDKTDLHSQLDSAWRQLCLSMLLVAISAPPAIIPWLKNVGIVSPDLVFARLLWRYTPDVNQVVEIGNTSISVAILVWIALGVFVYGLFRFSRKIKLLETLESFRDEAEKRLRVEGYMHKERAILEEKGK